MSANLLNQIGLALALFSGLLLIPEVFNIIPMEKLEKSIERKLSAIENLTALPLKFGPPSWSYKYTEEQRKTIEATTAIRSLIFSIIWIVLIVIGVRYSAKILIILSIVILVAVTLGNIAAHLPLWRFLNPIKLALNIIGLLLILIFVTPLISLIRVILLILHPIAKRIHRYFSANNVLRGWLTVLAITTFIISNILQFIATLYE